MGSVMQFLQDHNTLFTLVGYYIFSAVVGGMPAPTAQSSTTYQWAFATFNILASNIARARNTAVESSPNWLAAVAKSTPKPPDKP